MRRPTESTATERIESDVSGVETAAHHRFLHFPPRMMMMRRECMRCEVMVCRLRDAQIVAKVLTVYEAILIDASTIETGSLDEDAGPGISARAIDTRCNCGRRVFHEPSRPSAKERPTLQAPRPPLCVGTLAARNAPGGEEYGRRAFTDEASNGFWNIGCTQHEAHARASPAGVRHVEPAEPDRTLRRSDEVQDHAGERSFAAPGLADDGENLGLRGGDREADVVDGRESGATKEAAPGIGLGDTFDGEECVAQRTAAAGSLCAAGLHKRLAANIATPVAHRESR